MTRLVGWVTMCLTVLAACRASTASTPAASDPSSGAPASSPVRAATRAALVRVDPGDLRPDTLDRVAPRVGSLWAEPDELQLTVGDTLWLNDVLRVIALDHAGAPIGRLPVFDFRMLPGAAALVGGTGRGMGITGRAAGTAEMRLWFPRSVWHANVDARPTVSIPVRVLPRP